MAWSDKNSVAGVTERLFISAADALVSGLPAWAKKAKVTKKPPGVAGMVLLKLEHRMFGVDVLFSSYADGVIIRSSVRIAKLAPTSNTYRVPKRTDVVAYAKGPLAKALDKDVVAKVKSTEIGPVLKFFIATMNKLV